MINYFKILGISIKSSVNEIKSSYKNLMKKWHPDKFIEGTHEHFIATEESKKINDAYFNLKKLKNKILESTNQNRKSESNYQEKTSPQHGITKRTYVKSSNILSIGFDESKQILEIEFKKNHSVYHFYNVPKKEYINLLEAKSHGRYFINIELKYDFVIFRH